MRLAGFNIYTYDLPLITPISISGHTITKTKIKGITNASGLRLRLVMPFYFGVIQRYEQVCITPVL